MECSTAASCPAPFKPLPSRNEWRKWVKHSLWLLAVIIAVYSAAGLWAVRGDLARASQSLPWRVLPPVMGLVVLGWALRSLRWHYYVRYLRWPVSLSHSLLAFFASFAFSATPGKVGEVVKSVLLRTRYDVPLADGAGVLLVERLGDLLAILVLSAGGLVLLADGVPYFILAAALILGVTLLVSHGPIYHRLFSLLARVPRLAGLVEKSLRLLDAGSRLLKPTPFLVGIAIVLLAWGCEGCAFHLLIRGFGVKVGLGTSCSIYALATLAGALSALPGGLGSFEVVMVLLLTRLGLAAGQATLPVLLFRFCTFWMGSFLGLIVFAGWILATPAKTSPQPQN